MNRWMLWLTLLSLWTIALEVPVVNPSRLPGGQVISAKRYLFAKGVHVVGYTGLTLMAGWLRLPVRYRWLMMYFLMCHATVTELLQLALEEWCNRGGSLGDVGFNQIGIAIGTVIGWKWWMRADRSDSV